MTPRSALRHSTEAPWEPEPLELPLVDPGSSRLPRKTPRPYDSHRESDLREVPDPGALDEGEGERRSVVVIDLL